jgi:tetratricopeptide (TPR) repeat protein
MKDVLEVQEEITRAIVAALKLHINPSTAPPAAVANDLDTYNTFLKAEYFRLRTGLRNIQRAAPLYEQVLARDSTHARAFAGLARSLTALADDSLSPHYAYPKAEEAAKRALRLDPSLSSAHAALAITASLYRWRFEEAEAHLRRAVELNPRDPEPLILLGRLYGTLRKYGDAVAAFKQAQSVDPLSVGAHAWFASLLNAMGRYDEAVLEARAGIDLSPDNPAARRWLGDARLATGRADAALVEYRLGLAASPTNVRLRSGEARALVALGKVDEARAAVKNLEREAQSRHIRAEEVAAIYVALGDKDRAFQWLERAADDHSSGIAYIELFPQFDPIRSDPRFKKLLRRVGLVRG